MKTLTILDEKNYDPGWECYERYAVRAVIIRGDSIAMVRSCTEGWYKFPGGGIEAKETHMDALIRETLEETGLMILPDTVTELGYILERRKSLMDESRIFKQHSFYYLAEVAAEKQPQQLTDHEKELEYELEWVDIRRAYETDISFGAEIAFLRRESFVLDTLLDAAS